eukprot:gene8522-10476_t
MIPICQKCVLSDHNGHQFTSTIDQSDFIDIYFKSYQQNQIDIKDIYLGQCNQSYQKQENLITTTKNHYENQIELLNSEFKTIFESLQKREFDLRKQLEKSKEIEITDQTTHLSTLQNTINEFNSLLSFYEDIDHNLQQQQNNSLQDIGGVGENQLLSISKHQLFSNNGSSQSIELKTEYQFGCIQRSTVLVKKNQFIQDDTIFMFGGKN